MIERMLSVVRPHGDVATVRVEDVYDTTVDDLWSAVSQPARLARWIATVEGDLRVGGAFRARFTSSWEGDGRVEACEAPTLLRVVMEEDDGARTVIEATITADGGRARLVIEDRGIPAAEASEQAAGWQVHLEDLAAVLAGRTPGDWAERWNELRGPYRERASTVSAS